MRDGNAVLAGQGSCVPCYDTLLVRVFLYHNCCTMCCGAGDKKRFEDQLEAHPKLAATIEAYEQKQQDLKALKKGKSTKSSKKRSRKEATSDNEVTVITI